MLLPNHNEAQAAQRADAFRIGLSAATVVPELPELRMRVSIGVGAFCAQAHADADQFFGDVDRALYRAKAEGRNCVCRVAVCE